MDSRWSPPNPPGLPGVHLEYVEQGKVLKVCSLLFWHVVFLIFETTKLGSVLVGPLSERLQKSVVHFSDLQFVTP